MRKKLDKETQEQRCREWEERFPSIRECTGHKKSDCPEVCKYAIKMNHLGDLALDETYLRI